MYHPGALASFSCLVLSCSCGSVASFRRDATGRDSSLELAVVRSILRRRRWSSYLTGEGHRSSQWYLWPLILGVASGTALGTAFLGGTATLTAQTAYISAGAGCPVSGGWSSYPPSGPATSETAGGMAYDALDGYVVYFGGYTGSGSTYVGATWEFAGGCWKQLGNPLSPSPDGRSQFSMVWDGGDNEVLLFGGSDAGSQCSTSNSYYFYLCGDTWKFSGGAWTEVCSNGDTTNSSACSPSPQPRFGAMMAYDPVQNDCKIGTVTSPPTTGCVILFGGLICNSGCTGSSEADADSSLIWEFYGGHWYDTGSSATPTSRDSGMLIYDSVDNYLLLYGGEHQTCSSGSCTFTGGGCVYDNKNSFCDDAWSFTGAAWTQQCTSTADVWGNTVNACYPVGREGSGMVYDSYRTFTMMYGGYSGVISKNDTDAYGYASGAWYWAAGSGGTGNWKAMTGPGVSRDSPSMVYDAGVQDSYVLVLGGDNHAGYYYTTYVFK